MGEEEEQGAPAQHAIPADAAADRAFPVAGIGASAGGLDSFVRLLSALPAHPGVGLVLLQHLDPHQHSMLADILSHSSKMPITEAADGMDLEPDHVYVMPPNATMRVKDGSLVLKKRAKTSARVLPIDAFLESLSVERGGLSIGVVLSGTGTDGMHGLAAIRGAGGLTYAQEPSSAEYDGMPLASIDAGVVDAVLDPEGIAGELVRLGQKFKSGSPVDSEAAAYDEDSLRKILDLVLRTTGLDLTRYRRTTLLRRISRRMLLEGSESMTAYLAALEGDPAKVQALYGDVLVNMTQFFRDPVVLEALSRNVLPKIVERKDSKAPIRIWVPGCSKGQEAYSILMVVAEFLERAGKSIEIQMFASDVNEQDIVFARAGVYPEGIGRDVSPERLARFFVKVPGGYQVTRSIREMCVFATHDITQDPPFSRLDLISFRNVLIYMERPLQDHVLQVLHYALEPGGFLVLGTSESVGADSSFFDVVDKKNKIFSRRPGPAKLLPRISPFRGRQAPTHAAETTAEEGGFDVLAEADKVVQGGYQPAGLVLSPDLSALQFRGNVGPFLTPAQGPPDMKLSRLVPAGLAAAIEGAVREIDRSGAVALRSAAMQRDGIELEVDIEVVPIPQPGGSFYYLALLSERPRSDRKAAGAPAKRGPGEAPGDVAALTRERDEVREQLKAFVSERESASADLRAVSEKLQSSNEELRTINEEYQTAQEELQSTNEELTTLNDELRNRNAELVQLADDLTNVIEGVEIPILILSRDLRIRRFTPEAQAIVSLVPDDVGRPLTDLRLRVDVQDLKDRVVDVLDSDIPYVKEVLSDEGRWHSMRIRPYRATGGATDGVVIAFVDVHELKQKQRAAEFAREHAEAVIEAVSQPLVTLGADLTITEANGAFHAMFGTSPEETIGKSFFEMNEGTLNTSELRRGAEAILAGGLEFGPVDVDGWFARLGRRILRFRGQLVKEDVGSQAILLAIDDATVATRRQALTTTLNDISITLASAKNLDEVVKHIVKVSSESLSAESGALMLRQDDRWVMKGVYGLADDLVGTLLTDEDLRVAEHALRTGEPLLLSDSAKAARFASSLGIDPEHRSILMVPILFRGDPIGSLSFHFQRPELIFTEAEDDFARRLATMMAFALESAELFATQTEIAETLQGALLTLPRSLPGIEFGYLYRSADKAAAVGGDFYDMFELTEGRVGILIGDVSGKGVKAATLTSLVRNTIRALAYEEDSPAAVIAKASAVILRATPASMFVTLLFAVLNTSDGSLAYCSAGHTTGLVRKADGEVELLEEQSPLAGAFEVTDFTDGETWLGEADVLVLYTDGVTEARRNGDLFGQERLVSVIRELSKVQTRALPREIFSAVEEYTQGKLTDDVAIVAVTRKS